MNKFINIFIINTKKCNIFSKKKTLNFLNCGVSIENFYKYFFFKNFYIQ